MILSAFVSGLSAGSHTIVLQGQRSFGTAPGGTTTVDNEYSAGRITVKELRKAA
jgi:hypothetical protein